MKPRKAVARSFSPCRPEISAHNCPAALAHNPVSLLDRWFKLAARSGLEIATLAHDDCGPTLALQRPECEAISHYFSAGIHGDEPAGPLALLLWAEANFEWLRTANVIIFPCLNPWGLRQNSRLDKTGTDLNRSFRKNRGAMAAVRRFVGNRPVGFALLLHEDYDAEGIYLYLLGGKRSRAINALTAATQIILADPRPRIEGRPARRGVIAPRAIPASMDSWPEAIWLHSQGTTSTCTFETPSESDFVLRVQAHVEFLHVMVSQFDNGGPA